MLAIEDEMFAPARKAARDLYALYIGGMGARGRNFYNAVFRRQGYETEATLVQDLYLDGKKAEAAAALPDDFIDRVTLIGPSGARQGADRGAPRGRGDAPARHPVRLRRHRSSSHR